MSSAPHSPKAFSWAPESLTNSLCSPFAHTRRTPHAAFFGSAGFQELRRLCRNWRRWTCRDQFSLHACCKRHRKRHRAGRDASSPKPGLSFRPQTAELQDADQPDLSARGASPESLAPLSWRSFCLPKALPVRRHRVWLWRSVQRLKSEEKESDGGGRAPPALTGQVFSHQVCAACALRVLPPHRAGWGSPGTLKGSLSVGRSGASRAVPGEDAADRNRT